MAREIHSSFRLLNQTFKVIVLLCLLHMCVIMVFYLKLIDISFTFLQNQKFNNGTSGSWIINISSGATKRNRLVEANKDQQHHLPVQPMSKHLEKCPETSPLLVGPLHVDFNIQVSLEKIKEENSNVTIGGRFRPKDCMALQKVAVIIPFRNREEHLKYWLHYLHPILQRQQLNYGIYIINQDGDGVFNRAKLLNIGYVEALKQYDYECFVFSDIDIIPMDDRNLYKCFGQPRHLSVLVDTLDFKLSHDALFGGVTSMNKEQFLMINGYPNDYWGWGGEDDDLSSRLTSKGLTISRPNGNVGKCRMFRHNRDKHNEPNPQRFNRLTNSTKVMDKDGLNSLSYRVIKIERHDLFTNITVDVGTPPTTT